MVRKHYTSQFKTKIVLAVLQGEKELNEICSENNLNPNMVRKWKQEFLENAHCAFDNKAEAKNSKREEKKLKKSNIKLNRSHMFLTAIIDWYSRKIVGWNLSDTLDVAGVKNAVMGAVEKYGIPAIINSDQGSQFTSDEYKKLLKDLCIRQSMDGKSRWADNIIIERWFRSLKTDEIYINEYANTKELRSSIRKYIETYNSVRPHEALNYQVPDAYFNSCFDNKQKILASHAVA